MRILDCLHAFCRRKRERQNICPQQMTEEQDFYEPPCRQVLREKTKCESCGKQLTMHTLLYRHVCKPLVERRERAMLQAREAAHRRAVEEVMNRRLS